MNGQTPSQLEQQNMSGCPDQHMKAWAGYMSIFRKKKCQSGHKQSHTTPKH